MNKFKNVPIEKDTKIIFQKDATIGEHEVLYQMWFWDGVTAESIIYAHGDVSGLDDNEIEKEVRTSPLVRADSKVTIARSSGFAFINFNFVTE